MTELDDDLMSRQLGTVCRVMTRGVDGVATFAVYGPSRDMVWLSVHALTPTVVRLWPLVVRFLRDALADLADPTNATIVWQLPRTDEYPEYVLLRVPGGDPWLYIYAASPNAIRLTEDRRAFLREALADLPTMAAEHVAGRWRKALDELAAR
jgi:hypothetical protein